MNANNRARLCCGTTADRSLEGLLRVDAVEKVGFIRLNELCNDLILTCAVAGFAYEAIPPVLRYSRKRREPSVRWWADGTER
jgi:hypothetical protein